MSTDTKQKICIINTGGTLLETNVEGVMTLQEGSSNKLWKFMNSRPEFKNIVPYTDIHECVPKDSSNRTVRDWQDIAEAVVGHLALGYRGIVVVHGTDTLAYTSAALAMLIRKLNRPVIITGSQRSLDEEGSDALENVYGACTYALHHDPILNIATVACYFNKSLFRAARLFKVDSIDLAAFATPCAELLGEYKQYFSVDYIQVRKIVYSRLRQKNVTKEYPEDLKGLIQMYADLRYLQPKAHKVCEQVSLLHLHPGFRCDIITYLVGKNIRGFVLVGYGAGNGPEDLLDVIQNAMSAGVAFVGCSECAKPMAVENYDVSLNNYGVIICRDMTPHALLAKLAVVLANPKLTDLREEKQRKEFSRLFQTSFVGEMNSAGWFPEEDSNNNNAPPAEISDNNNANFNPYAALSEEN